MIDEAFKHALFPATVIALFYYVGLMFEAFHEEDDTNDKSE